MFGRVRVGGQIIWATKIKEVQKVEKVKSSGGKGGGGQKQFNVTYSYSVSVAIALCEGPIVAVGQVYADGKPIALAAYGARVYLGDEAQGPDRRLPPLRAPTTPRPIGAWRTSCSRTCPWRASATACRSSPPR